VPLGVREGGGVTGDTIAGGTRVTAPGATRGLSRTLGGLLVLAAGVLTVASAFMTWATIHAFGLMEIVIRGTDAEQYGGTTVLLGVLCVVLGGLLAGRARSGWEWIIAVVAGTMIVLTAVINIVQLRHGTQLGGITLGVSVEVGPGLWLTLLGGCAIVAGSLVARFGVRRVRPPYGGPPF
jgi:hypothetical protein